jgi:hypothetical protein
MTLNDELDEVRRKLWLYADPLGKFTFQDHNVVERALAVLRAGQGLKEQYVRAGLMEAALAATQVSVELKKSTVRDKMLGMYGANQVWHKIFTLDPVAIAREVDSK